MMFIVLMRTETSQMLPAGTFGTRKAADAWVAEQDDPASYLVFDQPPDQIDPVLVAAYEEAISE